MPLITTILVGIVIVGVILHRIAVEQGGDA